MGGLETTTSMLTFPRIRTDSFSFYFGKGHLISSRKNDNHDNHDNVSFIETYLEYNNFKSCTTKTNKKRVIGRCPLFPCFLYHKLQQHHKQRPFHQMQSRCL